MASGSSGKISKKMLAEFREDFGSKPEYRMAQNAVTQVTVDDVALNRQVVFEADHSFSHKLDDWKPTHQKNTGRCWMFAALNLMRVGAMQAMNVKEFEFSQNYTLFWDKFERSNYFLEQIINTADRDVDDRLVAFLLDQPLQDGGQWDMFINIIDKYGLVPKSLMPETESSSNTRRLNMVLLEKLREGAKMLRDAKPAKRAKVKDKILKVIFRILCIHLGTPPEKFLWQWNDKDKGFHRDGWMTPQEFAKKYVTIPLDDYICLVHDPRPKCQVGRTFTVEFLGNIIGGKIVKYLNVDVNFMKDVAMKTIVDGEPVWFGCDTVKMMRSDMGLWDVRMFELDAVYNTSFGLDKASRLEYHETRMTHAMLFTGVDVVDGRPRRWRVENSWGEERGQKGFYLMNDTWFDEYTFVIAARKSALPKEMQEAYDLEPIVLPPWDPMGALAM